MRPATTKAELPFIPCTGGHGPLMQTVLASGSGLDRMGSWLDKRTPGQKPSFTFTADEIICLLGNAGEEASLDHIEEATEITLFRPLNSRECQGVAEIFEGELDALGRVAYFDLSEAVNTDYHDAIVALGPDGKDDTRGYMTWKRGLVLFDDKAFLMNEVISYDMALDHPSRIAVAAAFCKQIAEDLSVATERLSALGYEVPINLVIEANDQTEEWAEHAGELEAAAWNAVRAAKGDAVIGYMPDNLAAGHGFRQDRRL